MQKKLLVSFLGVFLLSIGLNFILLANFGMSPFDTTTIAIQEFTGLNFGNAALVIHFTCLVLLIPFVVKKVVTISEMLLALITIIIITRVINAFGFITQLQVDGFISMVIFFIFGFVMFCTAGALLMLSNLVITPSDKLNITIAHYFNFHPGYVRMASDLIFLAISIFCAYVLNMDIVISLITILMGFGVGSIIRTIYNPLAKLFGMQP